MRVSGDDVILTVQAALGTGCGSSGRWPVFTCDVPLAVESLSPMTASVEATFLDREERAARQLIELALQEDFDEIGDLTCQALIDPATTASVKVVARKPGVLAGCPVGRMVYARLSSGITWSSHLSDGAELARGDVIATVQGPLDKLLMGERTVLNFLTHLSGIASLTQRYVREVAGTSASILDTRKTHPGYRLLEKYAVRCGGGHNHRMGLYDGVLIKDNHLAAWAAQGSIAEAVQQARVATEGRKSIEVEVDSLAQLRDALEGPPDIVLLDNMTPEVLREAVAIRNAQTPGVLLEASGGITLENLRAIADTGVERISIGALTHSAIGLDIALDWGGA